MNSAHPPHDPHDGEVHPHVHSVKLYGAVFGALLVFTVLTYLASFLHLGPLNLAVAIVIASVKATLVVLFFMHLKDDARFNALLLVGAVLCAGVFLAYTFNDIVTRGDADAASGVTHEPRTKRAAPALPAGFDEPVYPSGGR